MAIQIKLKNSVVQDSTPSTSDLPAVGELALNANINSIGGFMRASNNTIVKIFGPGSVTTPTATTTVSGISELATNSETTTGTATNRVVTPAGLNAVTVAERSTSNTNYVAKAGSTMTGALLVTNGTVSANSISPSGDANTGFNFGTDTVNICTAGANRLTVNSSGEIITTGNILIDGDGDRLKLGDGQDFQLYHTGTTNRIQSFVGDIELLAPTGKAVLFGINSVEKARIDSSGRLLVGTSSARTPGAIAPILQVEGTSSNTTTVSITRNSANNDGGRFIFNKSRGASNGSDVVVQDGDTLGQIVFCANDGTDSDSISASILSSINGTPGANDVPGQLVFSTTADGAASPTTRLKIDSAGNVIIPSNSSLKIGASQDLEIFHSPPSTNLIRANNGDDIRIRCGSDNMISIDDSGAVSLSYDGSTKFATTSAGVQVTGALNVTTTMHIPDGSIGLQVGNSNDLKIYHNGTHSFIQESGTGNLMVATSAFQVTNADVSETMIYAVADGSVSLYHNNSKKFETTSGGATVTGTLTATSFSGDGSSLSGINTDLVSDTSPQLGNSLDMNGQSINGGDSAGTTSNRIKLGTGDDFQFYHNGSHSFIQNSTNYIYYLSTQHHFKNAADNELQARFQENNAVSLYYDNSKKFETWTSGARLPSDNNVLALCAGDDLRFWHNATNSIIRNATGQLQIQSNDLRLGNYNFSETYIKGLQNGAVELYYDNVKKFETTSAGVTITGNTSTTGAFVSTQAGGGVLSDNLSLTDNKRVKLGAGDDLQIYHDGSESVIGNSTGTLQILSPIQMRLRASNFVFAAYDNSETMAKFTDDGAVELYFDNSKKFETFASGTITSGSHQVNGTCYPGSNNSYDLGTNASRWRNIYTNDLNLSNEGGANDVDGTCGSYTIQEGAEDLFLINNRSGKKYKFNLTEVA